MYVFLIYFLTDFDREGKVHTFFITVIIILNKGRKVLLLQMIQIINTKRDFPCR